MIDFRFELNDLPPSINKLYIPRVSRRGEVFIQKDSAAEVFEKVVWAEIRRPVQPFDAKMSISIIFEIKDKKQLETCDVDNMLKCLFDTLQSTGVIKNDKLFYKLKDIEKRTGIKDKVIGHITDL